MERSPKQASAESLKRGLNKVGFGPVRMFAEDRIVNTSTGVRRWEWDYTQGTHTDIWCGSVHMSADAGRGPA